jgi:hypothetical protein
MEAAQTRMPATIDGKPRRISATQATVMQLATKAARGDQKAMVDYLDWLDEFEARAAATKPVQFPFGPEDLEVLRATHARMKLCKSTKRGG